MLAPYEFQILPCTFSEVQAKERFLSSATYFRKRTNTVEKLLQDVTTDRFNMTSGNMESLLPASSSKPSRNRTMDRSVEDLCGTMIARNKYDLLLEQNKLKDEKISNLQAQIRILTEKNQQLNRVIGIIGKTQKDPFLETTKLNEVTNQLKDRKRSKK